MALSRQALDQHRKCQPRSGAQGAAQAGLPALSRVPASRGRWEPVAPAARRDLAAVPGLGHRPPGLGQDQVAPSNSSRAGCLGRADWLNPRRRGVVTSGIRRQQRKPTGGHLGSEGLGGAGSGVGGRQAEAEAESEAQGGEQSGAGAASAAPSMVGARSPPRPVLRSTSCTSSSAFSSGAAGGAVWRPRR